MTLEEVREELAFFEPGVVRLNPPAGANAIALAQTEMGVRFSPSLLVVLSVFNGGFIVSEPVLGVPPIQSALDMVHATRQARAYLGPVCWSDGWVEIGSDGCGNQYVLLLDRQGVGCEFPVGFYDAGAGAVTEIVASSYLNYLWFVTQDVKWHYRADGNPRAREEVDWTNRKVIVRPGALSPWRSNEAWTLAHDPALIMWR